MRHISALRPTALVLITGLVLSPWAGHAAMVAGPQGAPQTSVPRGWAAGSPYVDPARCGTLPDIISRMENGLGNTDDEIERTEEQLADARAGRAKSQKDRQEVFSKALVRFMQNMVGAARAARTTLTSLQALSPAAQAFRLTLYRHLDKIEHVDQALNVRDSAVAGYNFGGLLRASLADVRQLVITLQDSGISDQGVTLMSNAVLPVIGPLVVAHAALLRDYIFAEMQADVSEADESELESALNDLRNARRSHGSSLESLRREYVACSTQSQGDPARQGDSHLTPPLPEPPPPAPEKKSGMNDALFYGGLAALVGGAYVYSEYGKTSEPQCTPPPNNVSACFQNGSSPACQQWLAARRTYCSCLGLTSVGGNCQ